MPFPVDMKFVKQTEEKLGRRLPLDYVRRMTSENGGSVSTGTDTWFLHPIFDDSDGTRLKRTCNDVIRATSVAKGWIGFSEDCLAIGENGGGDRLVLRVADDPARYDDAYTGGTTKRTN